MAKSKDVKQVPAEEKALPIPRPGTSGTATLTNLTTTRLEAAKSFRTARRAERSYRNKKHAAAARAGYASAAEHYREGFHHLWMGLKVSFGAAGKAPAVVGERVEGVRGWWGQRRVKAREARRKRLEKELGKDKGGEGEEGEKTEGS